MNAITFEQLAHYLPYHLQIQIDSKIRELVGLESPYKTNSNFFIHGIVRELNGTYKQTQSMCLTEKTVHLCKPLLVPLSKFNNSKADDEIAEISKSIRIYNPIDLPYWQIQILFKHHFDVFGLIDNGLALIK